jgi:hypothetical protein
LGPDEREQQYVEAPGADGAAIELQRVQMTGNGEDAPMKMAAQLEGQLQAEQVAGPTNGSGADLQHLVQETVAAAEEAQPNPEQTLPEGQEDSIEDQLKQQLEHLKLLQANLMQESERLVMNGEPSIPAAVHASNDAQQMEAIYQKYNPELLEGAGAAKEAPAVLEENLELVAAVQNLNAMSHQFGLDPTIEMMGVNITDSTPQRKQPDCQNTPSAAGTIEPAS